MNSCKNEKHGTRRVPVTIQRVQSLWTRDTPIRLVLLLIFVCADLHSQVALDAAFLQALDQNGLTFRETALADYNPTRIVNNPHMNYELAVRSRKVPLEIRYAIRRYDPSPREAAVRPELEAQAEFMAVLLNIGTPANPKDPTSAILNSTEFEPKAVKNDFNAEWGATALVNPKKEFAGGFDRCMVVYIYRKRVGGYIFYMFKDTQMQSALEEIEKVFTTMRFR